MKKNELLNLLESVKQSYLSNINDANKGTILNYFEAEGIIPRASEKKSTPEEETDTSVRSSTSDLMEMDAKSNNGAGVYTINKETPATANRSSNTPQQPKAATTSATPATSATADPANPATPTEGIIPRKGKDGAKEEPKSETQETKSTDVVDKSNGYPEIKLTEELKNVDDKELDGVITKEECTKILNASDADKIEIYRNMLLIKESDVGSSDSYECFTTGKGGTTMTKGKVPSAYINSYYVTNGNLNNPRTNEPYSIFLSKNRASAETCHYMIMGDKYCVYTTTSNGDTATILTKAEFDLLFHLVKND